MFPLNNSVKLFLVLFLLGFIQGAYSKVVLNERDKRINELTSKVEENARTIENKNLQIEELENYKRTEEGLKLIVEWQNRRYEELKKSYDTLKEDTMVAISEMGDEQRAAGEEIHHIWDMYKGIVK